jgi:hypothetical protein
MPWKLETPATPGALRVGQKVLVEAEVTQVDLFDDILPFRLEMKGEAVWVGLDEIHGMASEPLKVGDKVREDYDDEIWTITAIDAEGNLLVKCDAEGSVSFFTTNELPNLERVK